MTLREKNVVPVVLVVVLIILFVAQRIVAPQVRFVPVPVPVNVPVPVK